MCEDIGSDIAVDSSGNAYVTGTTRIGFPTVNALQPTYGGSVGFYNAFVAKINASGSGLVYSTYLGSSDTEGSGIALDSSGNAYVTGLTSSTNFPTVNALQPTCGGCAGGFNDAFVSKINANGSALVYSTYLDGTNYNYGNGIAVDSSGNAYITGNTRSPNFPTVNAIQSNYGGGFYSAFVTKINASGSALVYSTYLGGSGSGDDVGTSIALDSSGNAYVTGLTSSTNFPTVNALQPSYGGGTGGGSFNAFVTKINSSGSALLYSTYLGGSGQDEGFGIAVDSLGNAYVTGSASSTDFPTVNALQPSYGGGSDDAFIAKIFSALSLSPGRVTFANQPVGTASAPQTTSLRNDGNSALIISSLAISGTNASEFAETDNCVGSVPVGTSCSINVVFTPAAIGSRVGMVSITNSFTTSPLVVPLTGVGVAATRIVTLSTSSLTFASQIVGATSAAQALTLTNTGNVALVISNLAISGANASEFSETDNCGGSLSAGANCTIKVTFSPTATGTRTGTLNITDNANTPQSPQSVPLTGTGTDFSLSAATGSNCPSGGNCSTSAAVTAPQTATYNLQVGPVSGFNGTVTLSCGDALAKSTCSVSPSSVNVNGTMASALTVTVTTTAASMLGPYTKPRRPSAPPGLPLLLVLVVALFIAESSGARHPRRRLVPALALLVLGLVWIGGCGGSSSGGGNPGTPSGAVTITGTSSGVTHSTSLNLTVN